MCSARVRHQAVGLPLAFFVTAALLGLSAQAAPARGTPFPVLAARDVQGDLHPQVLRQGVTNLVVIMTDRPASDGMRSWFDEANTRAPPSVHRVSLISLNLPFFVSDSTARRTARDNVPEQYWSDSFLDKDAKMAKTLDLPKSREPFVFVVDAQGRIVETAHGLPTDPEAERIWRSLDSP